MARTTFSILVMVLLLLGCSASGFAQSSIAGVVTDATAGVLPGVTVEVSSPALIEQARSVVSDANASHTM